MSDLNLDTLISEGLECPAGYSYFFLLGRDYMGGVLWARNFDVPNHEYFENDKLYLKTDTYMVCAAMEMINFMPVRPSHWEINFN